MTTTTEPTVIEGTNIVDPRTAAYAVTVSERMGDVTVLRWLVKVRDRVEPETIVALVEDRYGEIEVKAGESGRMSALMHPEGTRLPPHAVLCYIRLRRPPSEPPATDAPPTAPRAPRLIAQLHPHLEARDADPVVDPPVPPPTAAAPEPVEDDAEVELLTMPARRPPEPLASPVPIVATPQRVDAAPKKAKAKGGEPNTIGKKYRITPDQERTVGDIVHRLNRAPLLRDEVRRHKVRDSELIRALIEWFGAQSVETQAALIRANREVERDGRYGIGWPRPPRGGR